MQTRNAPTDAQPKEPKRGRGRPRKTDALTDAQRAARYRAKKKEQKGAGKGGTAAPDRKQPLAVSSIELSMQRELDLAQKRINDLAGALDVVVSIASKGKQIPADVLAGLYRLLSSR